MTITYHDLMHAARAALRAAGVDDEANKLEAQDLICAAAGKTPEQLYRDFSLYTTDAIAETIEKYFLVILHLLHATFFGLLAFFCHIDS